LTQNKPKKKPPSIIALCIVSASDIARVKSDFTYEWAENNHSSFMDLLSDFGMDTTDVIELQGLVQHRNKLNEIVICDRWVGNERTDTEWIQSGYASREAKDKASGCKLLTDLYRSRGMVG
jgi:hypothetical protein